MKLQEVLTEYQYNNVGQFRAIAESLGYKEAYNKGSLLLPGMTKYFVSIWIRYVHTQSENRIYLRKRLLWIVFASSLIGIRLYLPTIKAY